MGFQSVEQQPVLEIACFDEGSAIIAAAAGADRIELCRDYPSGGLSPNSAVLQSLKLKLMIPIYVMIRPRAGSFYYEPSEFETMRNTLVSLKSLGADGFVFGILNRPVQETLPHSHINLEWNKELVRLADGLPCTFHRAFDIIPESEWTKSLADIAACGFSSILTSGGPSGTNATDCVEKLADLVGWRGDKNTSKRLDSDKGVLRIIVGGGVRASNIDELRTVTGASVFHSAALPGLGQPICPFEVNSMKKQLSQLVGHKCVDTPSNK